MKKFLLVALCLLSAVPAWADNYRNGYRLSGTQAKDVDTNTSAFNGNLSSTDNTVQKALDTLDNMSAGGSPGGSDTQLQYNNSSAFGGITGVTSDGTSIALKNGATSAGYLDFNEDSDNGSNRVRLSGPASTADITLTLPSSDGDADQYLKTDGSGNMSWATVTAGVGGSTGSTDNAMLRADGTGGSTVQSSVNVVDDLGNMQLGTAVNAAKGFTILDAGTYATSGTLTYGGTNNTWVMSAPGIIDSGANYPPAFTLAINSSGLNTPAYAKIIGEGVRNGVLFYGGGFYGGLIAGRMGTQSGAGLVLGYGTGAGAADEWNSIVPATIPNTDNADPTRADNTVNLGRASYQFKNFYSVLGTFSGAVTIGGALKLTPAASPPGTPASGDIYVDSTPDPDELCFYDGAGWQGISSGTDANCA